MVSHCTQSIGGAESERVRAPETALNLEVKSIDESIADLQNVRAGLVSELSGVQKELNSLSAGSYATPAASSSSAKGKQTVKVASSIDYTQEFDWSSPLRGRMKQIFGIQSFRLCQEGLVHRRSKVSIVHLSCPITVSAMPPWMVVT